MSGKSAISNNSVKSNSEQDPSQQTQWVKQQLSTETNVKLAGDEAKDRLYEPKHKKKAVRVLTVVAYMFFVSLAAIMLSLYYVFIWNPHSHLIQNSVNTIKNNCDIVSSSTSTGINSQLTFPNDAGLSLTTTTTTEPPQTRNIQSWPQWQATTVSSSSLPLTKSSLLVSRLMPMPNYDSNETLYK